MCNNLLDTINVFRDQIAAQIEEINTLKRANESLRFRLSNRSNITGSVSLQLKLAQAKINDLEFSLAATKEGRDKAIETVRLREALIADAIKLLKGEAVIAAVEREETPVIDETGRCSDITCSCHDLD